MALELVSRKRTQDRPYGWNVEFERALIAGVCTRKDVFDRVGRALRIEYITDPAAKMALDAAQAIERETNSAPASSIIVWARLDRWHEEGRVTREAADAAYNCIEDAVDAGALASISGVIAEATTFVKRRMEEDALADLHGEYARRGDVSGKARSLFERIERVGSQEESFGSLLGADSFAELDALHAMSRLPTGIDELDFDIGGGLPLGNLGVIVGPTGGGKSMMLSQIAAISAAAGCVTGYITLELPRAVIDLRINCALTDCDVTEVANQNSVGRKECLRRLEMIRGSVGAVAVQYLSPAVTSMEAIQAWSETVEDRLGKKMTVLLIDYVNKVGARGHFKSKYDSSEPVMDGMRRNALDHSRWIWTAAQATRGVGKGRALTTDDVGESLHYVKSAALALGLTRASREEADTTMRVTVMKNTYGKADFSVGPIATDFAFGRLSDVEILPHPWRKPRKSVLDT